GKVVKEFDQTVVEVAGHTDSTGSESHNQLLSERRASTVSSYLQSRGVDEQRMITLGLGEAMPIADNNQVVGRQTNRRVEITMVPLTTG
ncbi:MAG: OmpA family protein, partial [Woeseiaceae bacterium]